MTRMASFGPVRKLEGARANDRRDGTLHAPADLEVAEEISQTAFRILATAGASVMNHSNFTKTSMPDEAPLDDKVLDTIGRALKAHYDGLVQAPMPARLLDLLAELEWEERDGGLSGGANAAK